MEDCMEGEEFRYFAGVNFSVDCSKFNDKFMDKDEDGIFINQERLADFIKDLLEENGMKEISVEVQG